MSVTLANLRVGVRLYLDEASQVDFLDTEVDREINYAYQNIVGKVIEVYELYYDTITPFTYALVANTQEYAIDASLLKVTRVEVNYNTSLTNSTPIRAQRVAMDEVLLQLNNNTTFGTSFFNSGYYIHGAQDVQTLGLVPVPQHTDTGGLKGLSVWGIASPATLVNETDTIKIPFPDNFGKLIELKAAGELLKKGQQADANAQGYLVLYNVGVQDMQTFIKERQADGPWMIEDYVVEDMDFQIH